MHRIAQRTAHRTSRTTRTYVARPATDEQRAFLRTLLEGAGLDPADADREGLTGSQANASIDLLMTPARQQAPNHFDVGADSVPAGRYAVRFGGDMQCFRVERPTHGMWAGFVFVRKIAATGEFRIGGADAKGVLTAIAATGPADAVAAYGKVAKRCSLCNHSLENPTSMQTGIGPECAKKF
jgi:hypothetical protein